MNIESFQHNNNEEMPPPLPEELPPPLLSEKITEAEGVPEKIEISNIPVINRDLMKLGVEGDEKMVEFLEEKKNLPPDTTIDFYHGLNAGLETALSVLESPDQGIKQISGPCLAVYPIGNYWKPGDAGFRYSIPRGQVEFPGENNPDAQFRIDKEGVVFLVNGLDTLPLTEFHGEVLRTEQNEPVYEEKIINGEWKDVEVGEKAIPLSEKEIEASKKIEEKLKVLTGTRKTNDDIRRLRAEIQAL